jgi:alkylhydroperoxidase/carboxymuconolactone decarboxylase family protein YurZ
VVAVSDLRNQFDDEMIRELRAAFDPRVMAAVNVGAFVERMPPLAAWARVTSDTFFDNDFAMAAKDRERCIVALLAYTGPPLSLAVHVYWALMEGVSPEEVCAAVSLAGCYGGLPKAAQGLLVLEATAALLHDVSASQDRGPGAVLSALLARWS